MDNKKWNWLLKMFLSQFSVDTFVHTKKNEIDFDIKHEKNHKRSKKKTKYKMNKLSRIVGIFKQQQIMTILLEFELKSESVEQNIGYHNKQIIMRSLYIYKNRMLHFILPPLSILCRHFKYVLLIIICNQKKNLTMIQWQYGDSKLVFQMFLLLLPYFFSAYRIPTKKNLAILFCMEKNNRNSDR